MALEIVTAIYNTYSLHLFRSLNTAITVQFPYNLHHNYTCNPRYIFCHHNFGNCNRHTIKIAQWTLLVYDPLQNLPVLHCIPCIFRRCFHGRFVVQHKMIIGYLVVRVYRLVPDIPDIHSTHRRTETEYVCSIPTLFLHPICSVFFPTPFFLYFLILFVEFRFHPSLFLLFFPEVQSLRLVLDIPSLSPLFFSIQ